MGTFIDTLNNNHEFKVSFKFEKEGNEWGYPISVYFCDNYGGDYRFELDQIIWKAVRAKLLFNMK
ncbi:hypothetical protein QP810_10040 [Streptococcus agalactiae]|uniref:hypothetical protein n=1 Tax=Streptococcus agalactiae TaxID=1311 RepID=UPI002556A9E8|nr:hypothetical protein [Streptococcus agalactiae]MDK8747564.1 hypothetical protein [Streptococcus agalactiae]